MNNKRIDISHKTVFFITGFLALLWGLFQIREVIILLFIAVIFMSAISPFVKFLVKNRIPKALAIVLIYIVIFGLLALLITMIISPLIEQTANLTQNFPEVIARLFPEGVVDGNLIQQQLGDISRNALTFTIGLLSNFVAFVSVAVLTFYLLLQRDQLDDLLAQFFVGKQERVKKVMERIEDKLGAWFRGQVALSFIIGFLVYLVLTGISLVVPPGIPYILPLAILAGVMEVVPVIGPIISSVPAILVAYFVSPILGVVVAVAYFIIQQLENSFIVPQVMKRAVGLNPLVVILGVAVGGKLLGISGALLAVPIIVVVQIITHELLDVGENEE